MTFFFHLTSCQLLLADHHTDLATLSKKDFAAIVIRIMARENAFPIEKMEVIKPKCLDIWDEVAEWLRRWTANPMCSARVGSNPILVVPFWQTCP